MKKYVSLIVAMLLFVTGFSGLAFAESGTGTSADGAKSVRTVMLYICGADLESNSSMATFNLMQILKSNFSKDGSVRVIVMTGGSETWHTDGVFLCGKDGKAIESISSEYNQVWEAKGLDAPQAEHPGKLVLIDGNGITGEGDEDVPSKDELMTEPETLKTFINYCVDNYPAEKYDLIMWDHGGGPAGGFGMDENSAEGLPITFDGLIDAFSDNKVTDRDGDGEQDGRFDFIDFDACLMSSIELTLAFAKYTDYYIASPETEPGYGQDYEGWLNMAGKDPAVNTYELGKKIVDDFYEFYQNGKGKGQNGTLTVFDTKRLFESDLIKAMNDLSGKLIKQATEIDGELNLYPFYDEIYSSKKAIMYGDTLAFRDLGNFAALLGANVYETSLEDVEKGTDNVRNEYASTSEWFEEIFQDKEMMYACGTSGVKSEQQLIRKKAGLKLEDLGTSGMYAYFPGSADDSDRKEYVLQMKKVIQRLGANTEVGQCLHKYLQAVIDYSLIHQTGSAVSMLLDPDEQARKEGIEAVPKNEISYDKIMEYWKHSEPGLEDYTLWKQTVELLFNNREDSEAETKEWLSGIIKQQVKEAVEQENISANKIEAADGTAYQVMLKETGHRAIDSIKQNIIAELPALKKYQESFPEGSILSGLVSNLKLPIGSIDANVDFDADISKTGDELIKEMVKWNLKNESTWNIEPVEMKWYAVQREDGRNLVAFVFLQNEEELVTLTGNEAGDMVFLFFSKEDGSLKGAAVKQENVMGIRPINPEDMTEDMKLTPAIYYNVLGMLEGHLPISEESFTLSRESFKNLRLVYTDIKNIPDIGDTDGDGKAFRADTVIKDIYGRERDITDKIQNPVKTLIGIDKATISTATYTKNHKGEFLPTFTLDGKTLKEGVDYRFVIRDKLVKPGEYYMTIEGIGEYGGRCFFQYIIKKGTNPLKIKSKTFRIRRSKLKKKSKTIKASKVIKTISKGAGKLTYKKTAGSKKITINKKTGKVTIKKGLKKGLYKIKVSVKAAGNSYYKAKTRKITLRIRVKK